jgi:hypothetical protein
VWFFSQVKLSTAQMQRVFLALLGPIVAAGFTALVGILTAKELVFTDDSNPAMSGGFGPNQVSAALGLGALISFVWALDNTVRLSTRIVLFAIMSFLLAQSALTFSRGGLYMAGGAAFLAALFLVRNRSTRVRLLVLVGVLAVTIGFVLLPRLDSFTGGALTKRFSDTRTTGRDELVYADLEVFSAHPVFGVGPGQTRHFRNHNSSYARLAAHTEFSRLLSEHGVFGAVAILALLSMAAQHVLRASSVRGKALAASMLLWGFLFMLSSAMRLVAPAFAIGLSAATIAPDESQADDAQQG